MTVDLELIKQIKHLATVYVTAHRGMTGIHLYNDLISQFPSAKREDVERAISELVQENQLVRLEYQIPDVTGHMYLQFYLPFGSRIL